MTYLTDKQFKKYSQLIHNSFGITYAESKKEILESKLKKLMLKKGINSYEEFYRLLTEHEDKAVWNDFIEEITVNKTNFFRESNHFDFIKNHAEAIAENNRRIMTNKEIRAWSAGCSTGEEAYTLSMVLLESFPMLDIKILATDLDQGVLRKAIKGRYGSATNNDIESYYLNKYFSKTDAGLVVNDKIKATVTFRQFNLTDEFLFKKGFDIIFCRNVMIYFDAATQQQLLKKFYQVLAPGGLLFIGHSEGLADRNLNYKYIQPAVYMKKV